MNVHDLIVFALQASIILNVFALGLEADLSDATYLLHQPRHFTRSLLAMFVAMPVLALLLGELFALSLEVKITLLCLAISPIPPLLPKKQDKAGGHSSYALGLMLCMALLALLFIPVWLALLSLYFHRPFSLAHGAIVLLVLKVIVAPLAAGMLLHRFAPALTLRLVRPVVLLANVLLPVCALLILVGSRDALASLVSVGTVSALLGFLVVGLLVGHLLGGPAHEDRIVLALSTASRHPGVAIALATANYPQDHRVPGLILLYLLLGLVVSLVYMKWQQAKVPRVIA